MASIAILTTIRRWAVDATLVRRTSFINSQGYADETTLTSTIKVVIQPLSPKEMSNLRRGQSVLEANNMWSEVELKNGDLITNPEGTIFTLQSVEFWREAPFYKATGVIEDAPG